MAPAPHETLTDMADVVRKPGQDRAKFQVSTTTAGFVPDNRGPSVNAQPPIGYVGGYDTTMLNTNPDMGMTVGTEGKQRAANMPSQFVETNLNKPVSTQQINVLVGQNRMSNAEHNHDTTYGQVQSTYHTVGSLDNTLRASNVDTDHSSDWSSVSLMTKNAPTLTGSRLQYETDFDVQTRSQAQTAVTKTNQIQDMTNRSNQVDADVVPLTGQTSTSRNVLLRNAQPLTNRSQQQDAQSIHRTNIPQNMLQSHLEITNWQTPAENLAADGWTDSQLVGISKDAGDNLNRSAQLSSDHSVNLSSTMAGVSRQPLLTSRQQILQDFATSSNLPSQKQNFRYSS